MTTSELAPHFKLSSSQLKSTHPWRLATQKPNTVSPLPVLEPEEIARELYLYFSLNAKHSAYALHKWQPHPQLAPIWTALIDKCKTMAHLRAELTPLDVALLLETQSRQRHDFDKRFAPLFSLLKMSTEPEAACCFLIDAMAQTHRVHEAIFTDSIPCGALFPQIESFLALAMRRELCHVPQTTYDAVHAHAHNLHASRDNRLDSFLAILFPEEVDWGNQAIAAWQHTLTEFKPSFLPHARRSEAEERIVLEPLFSSGADIEHMRLLARIFRADFHHERDDRWDTLFDLLVTHDRDAIPVLEYILDRKSAPSINVQPLFGLLNMSEDPTLLTAFARRLITGYNTKKSSRDRFIKKIQDMPDFVTTSLPPLLEELETHYADREAFAHIQKLVQKHALRKLSREKEASQQDLYISAEDLPDALRTLPWHAPDEKAPELPGFFSPLLYPRLLVREDPGRAIPLDLYEEIGRILISSDSGLLAALADFIEPGSMSRFCVQLFEDWDRAGHPRQRHDWVCQTLLYFGKTELTKTLHDRMDLWLSYSRSNPGKILLSMLQGDDPYHLELLDSLHHGAYSTDSKRSAHAVLEQLAITCGLGDDPSSIEDLLDARTATLGVSRDGRFSPDSSHSHSSFLIRLDSALEPYLVEDEERLSEVATLKWQHTRDLFRHHFRQMTDRLEHALIVQRRWSPRLWREHLAAHPLLANLARHLVWCDFQVSQADGLPSSEPRFWRPDESMECLDLEDERVEVNEAHVITLAHPLQMSEEERQRWLISLSDYEIIQPFDQLQRLVHKEETSPEALKQLIRRTTSHEKLHRLYTQFPWEAIPLGSKSSRFAGYRIYLKLDDGKYDRGAFRIKLVRGIHKDAKKREDEYRLETFVRFDKVPWDRVDPIQRSELIRALIETFSS